MAESNTNRQPKENLGAEVGTLLKSNVRNYTMYLALVAILIFFNISTKGLFLSSRNISDLINQTGYVAVLAIGMTLILIIRHIDLSVGYVAGFLGAVAATLLASGIHVALIFPIILVIGIVIGLYQGILVAYVGVPAFVTTLAGMFIFRGLLSMVTAKSGTIIVQNDFFKSLSNGYIPDFFEGELHTVTLMIGAVAVVLMFAVKLNNRHKLQQYNFKVPSMPIFIVSTALMAVVIMLVFWVLAGYKGLPITALIVGVILFIYNFMLNKTRLGRYIYGIGGNTEAALLSGINVKKVTLFVFASMSMLAAVSGILYTSRLASATPTAGLGFEMEAIASSYIGGVSVSGGVGKVTNTIIGALIMSSLTNGMNLMGLDISFQYVIKGAIFILAVAFDVKTRSKA
ncbi:sugar ABC transporter permease [Christensenellaceae bacterium OttesenSCG-928-M15]|nr:sugar ABC transporter permease [Christensenellaceae bacterium OttesenSCG-928-M15]